MSINKPKTLCKRPYFSYNKWVFMVITSYGFTSYKLQSGETVVAIDPPAKGARFEAAAALFTNPESTRETSISGSPHIFATPGEYEVSDIGFVGFSANGVTPFLIEWEGMRLLHLGALGKMVLSEDSLDRIGTVDILFVSASAPEAQKLLARIDPRVVIPMETDGAKKGAVETFIKEVGEKPERMDKLTIKAKGLPQEGQRLVVLTNA